MYTYLYVYIFICIYMDIYRYVYLCIYIIYLYNDQKPYKNRNEGLHISWSPTMY